MTKGNPGQMVPVIHTVGRSTGPDQEVTAIFDFSIWKLSSPGLETASPLLAVLAADFVLCNSPKKASQRSAKALPRLTNSHIPPRNPRLAQERQSFQ